MEVRFAGCEIDHKVDGYKIRAWLIDIDKAMDFVFVKGSFWVACWSPCLAPSLLRFLLCELFGGVQPAFEVASAFKGKLGMLGKLEGHPFGKRRLGCLGNSSFGPFWWGGEEVYDPAFLGIVEVLFLPSTWKLTGGPSKRQLIFQAPPHRWHERKGKAFSCT